MRVLVDVRHLVGGNPSGVGQYTRELLRALLPLDPTVSYTLLSTGFRKPTLPFPLPPNTKHVHIQAPNRALFASMAVGFPKLDKLVNGPFDVIFVPNLHMTPLSAGVPMVLTIHDASWLVNPSWFSFKTRLWHHIVRPHALVKHAARVIVPSESTAREAQTFLGADASKIRVIPHGVDPKFSPKPTPQDHGVRSRLHLPKRYALFLGTLEPRKNVDAIIEAVRLYREKTGDRISLVLAGSWGFDAKTTKRLVAAGIKEGWMRHVGYVPDADRHALYRCASVFLFPSHMEGFGMPVLEAMASGTPVITSPRGALPEVAGDAAMYTDPLDPNRIVICLEQLFGSPELRTRLTARGLERSAAFPWKETARKTLDLLIETARVVH